MVIFARDLFAFFVIQEPFAKVKTAKMFLSTCKMNELHCNLGTIYIAANRSLSASVTLTAITRGIQGIEMLRKHKPDSGARPRAERIVTTNVELKLPSLFVNDSRHSLNFQR